MKRDLYKCDRCGEEFNIPSKEVPDMVSVRQACELDKLEGNVTDIELCSNCAANLALFISRRSDVDKLLEPLWEK